MKDTLDKMIRDFTRIDKRVTKAEVRRRVEEYGNKSIADFLKGKKCKHCGYYL